MKSNYLLIFLILFLTIFRIETITSQENKAYEYLGVIKLNDTSFIPYRLAFEENNGIVSGYSLSDMGGAHETKSSIKGTYKAKSNELSFEEYDIVYTKSPIEEFDMCLVHFNGTLKNLTKNKAFSGDFNGLYPDGTKCIDGKIILSNMKKVEARVQKLNKRIRKTKHLGDEEKKKASLNRTLDTISMSTIKANENLNVFVKHRAAAFVIYDAGKVDDDRISITVNGELVVEDYSIVREKKELEIILDKGKSVIEVIALNEGTKPLNTVKVEILDGNDLITTHISLKTGEKISLTLLNQ